MSTLSRAQALEHVSKRLKMNMMIVETAIKQNPDALVYAAPEVRNNPAVMPVSASVAWLYFAQGHVF